MGKFATACLAAAFAVFVNPASAAVVVQATVVEWSAWLPLMGLQGV